MATSRAGLISNTRTMNGASAPGMHSMREFSALKKSSAWPGSFAFKLTSTGSADQDILPGASGYIRHGGEWAHTITPYSNITVTFHLWGAAGGTAHYSNNLVSGNGGLVHFTAVLTGGTTYYVYVGERGDRSISSQFGVGGWPNGGTGGNGDADGSGGGGMTMLSKATFSTGMSDNDILAVAGAGGGHSYSGGTWAGSGGGASGSAASGGGGGGGTASAGGAGTVAGAKLQGGSSNVGQDGGGGGGGYYGGGGNSGERAGGGGSSWFNTNLVTSGTFVNSPHTQANTVAAAPDNNSLLANSGYSGLSVEKYAQGVNSGSSHSSPPHAGHGLVHYSIA